MKRFATILLVLAMLASMGSIAYAAEGSDTKTITSIDQSESADIYGVYKSADEPGPVYSVNISWPSMIYTYEVVNPKWMPSVHRYDGDPEFSLSSGARSRKITVSNSSNRKVSVNASVSNTNSLVGLELSLIGTSSFELDRADIERTPTENEFVVQVDTNDQTPTITPEQSGQQFTIGTVTITLSAAGG